MIPILTIIMPSYNKQQYIAQALDSVFMQETSYDYQIIVADDCSTDQTVNIVEEYQAKNPHKIILLTSEKNQKLYHNILRAYAITKTDYFCVLDPDDFWLDKHKIQKALDFLEIHRDYTIYVTDTLMQLPDGQRKPFLKRNKTTDSTWADYLHNRATIGCTLGSFFRNVVFKQGIPEKMRHLQTPSQERSFRGDSFRTALHLHEGKVHYVPELDGVYRITPEGIWQGLSFTEQAILNATIYKDIWLYFDKQYPELLYLSYIQLASIRAWTELPYLLLNRKNQTSYGKTCKQLSILEQLYKENQQNVNQVKKEIKLSVFYRIKIIFLTGLLYLCCRRK